MSTYIGTDRGLVRGGGARHEGEHGVVLEVQSAGRGCELVFGEVGGWVEGFESKLFFKNVLIVFQDFLFLGVLDLF